MLDSKRQTLVNRKISDNAFTDDEIKKLSLKFRNWTYWSEPIIAAKPKILGFDDIYMVDVPTVFQLPNDKTWYMSFIGYDGKGYQTFIAASDNMIDWYNFHLAMGYGPAGEFDYGGCVLGAYLYESYNLEDRRTLKQLDGKYWSLYGAYPRQGGYELRPGYEGIACSNDGFIWERAVDKPILSIFDSDVKTWEKDCIYQPWLLEHEGRYINYYNAADGDIERLGVSFSNDLKNWRRYDNNPIIDIGGWNSYNALFSSDLKVFRYGDIWIGFFFGVNRSGAHIMIAFSRDVLHWTVNPEPLYFAGGHPNGLDSEYAHKISIIRNPMNDILYMFYCATGKQGRNICLLTSQSLN